MTELRSQERAQRCENVMCLPCYTSHPTVKAAAEAGLPSPLPISIYMDGVSYSDGASGRQESVYGLWVINCLSGRRHLVTSLKTGDYCCCGCGGWCTLWPCLKTLQWQLLALQEGRAPERRPDGSEWSATELRTLSMVPGTTLQCRGQCIKRSTRAKLNETSLARCMFAAFQTLPPLHSGQSCAT